MKYLIFALVYLVNVRTYSCNEMSIICKTVCAQDGDDKGIVIDNKCYCANYRDLSKIIARVPLNGGLVANKPKRIWDE